MYYDNKPYIPETLQADLLQKNHDDPLARYFEDKKILEHLCTNITGLRWGMMLRNKNKVVISIWEAKYKDINLMAIYKSYLF